MSPRPLTTAAALLLLAACQSDHGHDGHDHDGHDHAAQDHDAGPEAKAPTPTPASQVAPSEFALGSWTATLQPTAEGLRLSAKDAEGKSVTPKGEARVVLTGTGEEGQRVVLAPGEGGWSGGAEASGAPGYIAVVSLDIDGNTESARITWGEVPEAAPAPKAEEEGHDHDEGGEHGHGHGH